MDSSHSVWVSMTGFSLILLIGLAATLVAAAILQWLWNMTAPEAFGTRPIRFWVAFRLLLIGALISSGGFLRFNLGG